MKNQTKQAIIDAVIKGYYIKDGCAYSMKGKLKLNVNTNGYYSIGIRKIKDKRMKRIPIHRLVAYQKYGILIFRKGYEVRHLDSNKLNNLESNIKIGTPSQNANDKPESARRRAALNASSFAKKHNHEKIIEMHNSGKPYGEIMKELNIKSKGTISFIINQSMSARGITE